MDTVNKLRKLLENKHEPNVKELKVYERRLEVTLSEESDTPEDGYDTVEEVISLIKKESVDLNEETIYTKEEILKLVEIGMRLGRENVTVELDGVEIEKYFRTEKGEI